MLFPTLHATTAASLGALQARGRPSRAIADWTYVVTVAGGRTVQHWSVGRLSRQRREGEARPLGGGEVGA